jgi:GBP family porin
MKKALLTAAILASVASAASAQSNVTVYGIIDIGLASVTNAKASTHVPTTALPVYTGGDEFKLQSGIQGGSRLGFRGTEDLGGGLSAMFNLESGILADTGASDQGGLLFGRQAWVGVKSNSLGAVTLGRQNPSHYLAWKSIDPLDDGFGAAGSNLLPGNGKRINNSIKYATPTISGFNADLFYGLGEVTGSTTASRTLGTTIAYQDGPLMVKLAYHSLENATATDNSTNTLIGGTYNFGIAKAHLVLNNNKGTGTVDNRDTLVGLTVPMGASSFMLSYISKDDKTTANRDATQLGLAYTYALSKRTGLYAAYAKIENDNGATYRTANSTAPISGQTGAVGGTQEINVGLRHTF